MGKIVSPDRHGQRYTGGHAARRGHRLETECAGHGQYLASAVPRRGGSGGPLRAPAVAPLPAGPYRSASSPPALAPASDRSRCRGIVLGLALALGGRVLGPRQAIKAQHRYTGRPDRIDPAPGGRAPGVGHKRTRVAAPWNAPRRFRPPLVAYEEFEGRPSGVAVASTRSVDPPRIRADS